MIYVDITNNKKELKQKDKNMILVYVNEFFVINEKKAYKTTIKKINKKLKKVLKKNENEKIIPSEKIIEIIKKFDLENDNNYLSTIIENQEKDKTIYRNNVVKILNNLIKLQNKEPKEQSIYVLTNDKIEEENIRTFQQNYKMLYIVTTNTKTFRKMEEKAEENLEMLAVVNNKRKSLSRAQYIINYNFAEEQINEYTINRDAIILNLSKTKITVMQGFSGVIVNNIKLLNSGIKFPYEFDYKNNKQEIEELINNKQYELIGNNGVIEKVEFNTNKLII